MKQMSTRNIVLIPVLVLIVLVITAKVSGQVPDNEQDYGMIMREGLRTMPDAELSGLVENSGLTVMIGFKEETAMRGVSRYGEPLLSEEQTKLYTKQVIESFCR